MALQKQTVSLNLGNGMDQKTDDKVGPDNKFSIIKNWIYSKLFKLYKRFGTDKLTNLTNGNITYIPSLATTNLPSSVFTYDNQLLLQNNGYLYSYNQDETEWTYKGHYHPIDISTNVVVSDEKNYSKINSYQFGGKTFVFFSDGTSVFYSCIDSNGNYIKDTALIQSVSINYNIVVFASRMFFLYINPSTNRLIRVEVLDDGSLGGSQTVENSVANTEFYVTRAVITGAGERYFVSVISSASTIYKLITLQSNGLQDPTFSITAGALASKPGALYFDENLQVLLVHFINTSSLSQVENYLVTYSGGAGNISFYSIVSLGRLFSYGAWVKNPIDTNIYFFGNESSSSVYTDYYWSGIETWDTGGTPWVTGQKNKPFYRGQIYYFAFSPLLLIVPVTKWLEGYDLIIEPIEDTTRSTFYVFIKNFSYEQQTCFALDWMAYTRDQDFCVIAKWNDSTAADDKEVTKSTLLGGKIYFATNKVTDFIADPRASGIYYNDELFRKKSIYQVVIDLEPDYSSSFGTLSKASHLSGGILNYYDGSNPYESSFFINPEYIDLSVVYAATGHRRNEIIIQNQGTVSTNERFYVLTKNGAACLAGPTYYWTFYTTTTTISVSYRIDGVGTAGGPGVQVLVDINSYDSAYSVALKTFNALNAVASSYAFTISIRADRGNVSYGPQLYIQNTINGAVTDATNANFSLDPGNSFAGSTDEIFTYCFLWKFYDVHGQLMYSAPSLPRQIKFTAAVGFTFITGYIPNLTNKDISKVIIDIYRTTNNGTIFYKLTNQIVTVDAPESVPTWINKSTWGFSYLDNKRDDALLLSPEFIYTNGGILPNWQLPNAKFVTTFKNRVIGVTEENPTAFYYSKSAINGAPIEFAAENFVQVDVDLDPITGLAQLDDKLIVFKKEKIYYLAGDGSNDLGANSSFSFPTLIASDVGCVSHNSIVLMPLGLIFKSEKGIYLIDRALQVSYVGKEVEDYNQYTIMKGELIEKQNQIRFVLKEIDSCLVYDYLFNRWTVFEPYGGNSATIWKGLFSRVDSSGRVYVENQSSYKDTGSVIATYNPTFTTKWLQIKNVQDYQRIYRVAFLGDLKSKHTLNIKVYYDYDETNFDQYNFDSSLITGTQYDDTVYQPLIHLKRQKCDALKFVVTVIADGETEQCLELVDMSLQVGIKQGLMKVKADKRL